MGQLCSQPRLSNRRTTLEDPSMNAASETPDGTGSAARDEAVLEAKHKVFLSHSGAQKNFVEQMCVDLERHDRYPFFDKRRHSLPIGENFPEIIFHAISQCQVGVLILSEEFFTRTKWPMLELAALVESKKQNSELVIMPVFLGISREECRNVENHKRWESVWLKWMQTDPRIDVEKWKQALLIFGPTNSLIYKEVLGEVKFREEIVEAVCERVPPETRWDDSHVQGRSRLCQVIREKVNMTQVSKSFDVRVMGLYGVGGVGKTTICKTLCNNYSKEFQDKVAHVEFGNNGEVELMRGVLRKLTDTKREVLVGFDKGECTMHLKKKVHQHNVFLAIDNVSDTTEAIEQARIYLQAGFSKGSVVIVTARSKEVLKGVGLAVEDCVKMPKLDTSEAMSLFLHQVLGVPDEINAHDKACITRCVELCRFREGDDNGKSYLPLALKLLGVQCSTLGYNPEGWVEEMFDTSNKVMGSVFGILRRSFDDLSDDDKLLFMDVVLYCPGHCMYTDTSYTTYRFHVSKWLNIFEWLSIVHQTSVECLKLRLQELKRKSLIEELGEHIGVHDLWRDFAKKETKVGHLECRRWVHVLDDEKNGFEEVEPSGFRWGELRRMCFINWKYCQRQSFTMINVTMLTKLQYCSNVTVLHLVGSLNSTHVIVLDSTAVKCLRSLVLYTPRVEVRGLGSLKSLGFLAWKDGLISPACLEDIGHLTSLQFLQLSYFKWDPSEEGNNLPDLTNLKLLKVVQFEVIHNVNKLSGFNYNLSRLQKLKLRLSDKSESCTVYGVPDLMALEELEIDWGVKVEEVFSLEKLTKLQKLSIFDCQSIKELPGLDKLVALKSFQLCGDESYINPKLGVLQNLPSFSKLTNLQKLHISYQKSITALEGLSEVVSLQELKAAHCCDLREVSDIGKLTNLQVLDLRWCSVQALPGLGELVALKELVAQHCYELSEIPNLHKLSNLQKLDLQWCALRTVGGLDGLVALESFFVQHSGKLVALPGLCKLRGLKELDTSHCSSLEALPSLERISKLNELKGDFQMLSKLHKLPAGLEGLEIVGWGSQYFPSSTSLNTLQIHDCRELDELNYLPTLARVFSLTLKRCNFGGVSGLTNLTALQQLFIYSCCELERLPDLVHLTTLKIVSEKNSKTKGVIIMGNLPELQYLVCRNLAISELPDLSSCCPKLKMLTVNNCKELRSLTCSGPLTALESLTLWNCGSLRELPDLGLYSKLQYSDVRYCGVRVKRRPLEENWSVPMCDWEWEALP